MSKVVLYQHESLSSVARAVLQHYQRLGFLEVVPFDIPMTGGLFSDFFGKVVFCVDILCPSHYYLSHVGTFSSPGFLC